MINKESIYLNTSIASAENISADSFYVSEIITDRIHFTWWNDGASKAFERKKCHGDSKGGLDFSITRRRRRAMNTCWTMHREIEWNKFQQKKTIQLMRVESHFEDIKKLWPFYNRL